VMLALTGALILALTLMPVLCSFLLRGRIGKGDNVIIRAAKNIYEPLLRVALAARWLVVIAALAVFVGSLWLFTHLGAEFVPKLDEGSITEVFYKPVGTSLEESVKIDIELEKILLRDFPEITHVFSRTGTNDIATDPMPSSESDVFISYKPIKEWPRTGGHPRNKAELHAKIGEVMKRLSPKSNLIFSQPIEERFDEMLEGTKAELSMKIYGDDYDVLDKLAEQIMGILEKTPGAGEIEYETEGRTGHLLIEVKHEVKMPEGYIVEFGGAYKNLQQARARSMIVVPAALALIFILIYLAFGSIRQALLVYTGIPLDVTGGVLSLWLRGMPFSITAA